MPLREVNASAALLEELAEWVRIESPTTDGAAVNRLLDMAEKGLAEAGAVLRRTVGRDGFGDTLLARTPETNGRLVLLLGHLDTVWDHGTLATMPFRIEGERAHGPGIYDMKAGSFLGFHVLRTILRRGKAPPRPIALMLTPDEEVGSPTSRALIEEAAADAAMVLVLEPAGAGGACVTARKGVGRFVLRVAGHAAHAGGAFEDGASAVVELAEQIRRLHAMVDLPAGITLNVAPVWGGTRPNVIAAEAGCEIDLRVPDAASGERLERMILGLAAVTPGCVVTVAGGMNRPPFAETPTIAGLYARARKIATEIGIALPRQHRGGGSDGNFTAAMGVPTLDGLGCPGGGAHADHEHILWQELAPRARLLAGLLEQGE
ncbi:MAG: M20 family metallopeptidase [Rhodospirillales bacterium]|nr:M20 family metallopeptidase [Rhodospirillales bacterium]